MQYHLNSVNFCMVSSFCHLSIPFSIGAILIDTDGLSQHAIDICKATQKDIEAARKLEIHAGAALLTEGATKATVYREIMEAKFRIDGSNHRFSSVILFISTFNCYAFRSFFG